jgi:hypothetical protein
MPYFLGSVNSDEQKQDQDKTIVVLVLFLQSGLGLGLASTSLVLVLFLQQDSCKSCNFEPWKQKHLIFVVKYLKGSGKKGANCNFGQY